MLRAKNKNEMPVRPNTLKVIQSSVLKLRQATSLAIAEVMNIATQSQLMARHPSVVSLICLPIIVSSGLRPKSRPPAINAANNKVTTVVKVDGLITGVSTTFEIEVQY